MKEVLDCERLQRHQFIREKTREGLSVAYE